MVIPSMWGWLRSPLVQGFALIALVVCAYAGSFDGVFVFDDRSLLIETSGIEEMSLLAFGVNGAVSSGRPLTAATFWINVWLDPARRPFGFHLFNLFVHVVCVLLGWGFLRRTFERVPGLVARATSLAFVCVLLWGLQPLQTNVVTYVAQRAESLLSLCVLAALYCSTRGWSWGCVLAGFAAVLSKEVAAVLPLLVLLHDRNFDAGSFRGALVRRPWMYAGLGASWVLLGWLVAQGARTGSVGFEFRGLHSLNYALTQPNAILHYLRLLVWPDPLVLDYGWPVVPVDGWADLVSAWPTYLPSLLAVGALGVVTVGWIVRNHPLGFAGASFFLLLAPSSSFLPITTEIMAEHRMHLASLAPLSLLVIGFDVGLRRFVPARATLVFASGVAVVALLWAAMTDAQNQLYRSDELMWSHNLLATPDNPRVLLNLGRILRARGEVGPALLLFERAAAASRACRRPRQMFLPEILDSSADAWQQAGDLKRANQLRAEAWGFDRSHGERAASLAMGLQRAGKSREAIATLREGIQHVPDAPQLRAALISTLLLSGELDKAREEARRLSPQIQAPELDRQLIKVAERLGRSDLARALAAQGGAPRAAGLAK
ncbi:MAG TPA: tetratricopeptide repeat protein [Polyangiales bacterium]|nr:tetratricopeptide repeat protein [Polyangiales bacterium]